MTRALADDLAIDGFAVLELLEADQVTEALRWTSALPIPRSRPFASSHAHLEPGIRRQIDVEVRCRTGNALQSLLPGYRPVAAAVVWKPAEYGSTVPLHQDLTYTDERTARSFVAWIPLVNINESTGELLLLPGSHRWSMGIRPGGRRRTPTAQLQEALLPLAASREVPAGHAAVWDVGLIHGTKPNVGPLDRPALAVSLVPISEPIRFFHQALSGRVEGFLIDEEHFFTPSPFADRPEGYPGVEPHTDVVTVADLASRISA